MTLAQSTKEKCKACGREIEICECCHDQGCPDALCYDCLNRELKHTVPQPHAHGG